MVVVEQVVLAFSEPMVQLGARYALLGRARRVCESGGVRLLGFSLDKGSVWLILEGTSTDISRAATGIRRGTANQARGEGRKLALVVVQREPVRDLTAAIAACHRAPDGADPLSAPWTSHRDLLGLRRASFYDSQVLHGRVDPREVHERAGGSPLPPGWPPTTPERVPLSLLLRVASAVVGVLPADRRSFAVFVHLARLAGHPVRDIARALALTPRRVRQLLRDEPTMVAAAAAHLGDPRLLHLPGD